MRIWTAHEKTHAAPVLVREGFSWRAAAFGPFWLAARRAWVPAGMLLLLDVLILVLTHAPASLVLILGMALLMGLSGHDLVRWSLSQSGYFQTGVIVARDEDEARIRFLNARPDLVEREMVAETAA